VSSREPASGSMVVVKSWTAMMRALGDQVKDSTW